MSLMARSGAPEKPSRVCWSIFSLSGWTLRDDVAEAVQRVFGVLQRLAGLRPCLVDRQHIGQRLAFASEPRRSFMWPITLAAWVRIALERAPGMRLLRHERTDAQQPARQA